MLIVCPASLKLNWLRELRRWLVRPLSATVLSAGDPPGAAGEADVLVINYDILDRFPALLEETWDILCVDECQMIRNPKTKRSKLIKKLHARHMVFLTGTPIVNRPRDLYPVISKLDPRAWGSFWSFAQRYCNPVHTGWGWDFSGASNLDELQRRLRSTIMLRRLKRDVLHQLPAKLRQVIEVSADGLEALIEREQHVLHEGEEELAKLQLAVKLAKASEDPRAYKQAVAHLQKGRRVLFEEMSRVRHDTALAKVPYVTKHIDDALEAEGKIVVFAHHHDVVKTLHEHYPSAAVLTGETPVARRMAAVDRFQDDDACRVFIGSITAAGLGLTLTASSHVIFAELDWVPGNVTQAEDRLHRIGQRDNVLVQHVVLEGSLDATMAKRLVEKQEIIDRALDENGTNVPYF